MVLYEKLVGREWVAMPYFLQFGIAIYGGNTNEVGDYPYLHSCNRLLDIVLQIVKNPCYNSLSHIEILLFQSAYFTPFIGLLSGHIPVY